MIALPFSQLAAAFSVAPELLVGAQVQQIGLAAARALPFAILLPTAGLPAFPVRARAAMGAILLTAVTPALLVTELHSAPAWPLLSQFLTGLPVALMASLMLWTATMTGDLLSDLQQPASCPPPSTVGPKLSSLGGLLGLAAVVGFFQLGGPSRIANALLLAQPDFGSSDWLGPTMRALLHSISIAIALASPLFAVRLLSGMLEALLLRATPSYAVFSPVRTLSPLAHLTLLALLLDRLVEQLLKMLDTSF